MVPNIHKHDEIIRVLHQIQSTGFHSAVVAGGAVRDIYFNLLARDIDVFIWDPNYSTETVLDQPWENIVHPDKGPKLIAELMRLRSGDQVKRDFYGGSDRISAVWNVSKNFFPYQLIFLKRPPLELIDNHFDFGICKCYCDGQKFRFTPHFMQDARNKTITLVGRDMTQKEYEYTMNNHLPRIQEKFPGFTLQTASWNTELVAKYTKT